MGLNMLKVLPMVNDGFPLIFEIRYERQAVNPPDQWIQLVHEITVFLKLQLNCRMACRTAAKRPAHPFLRD
jgi:hypothetical protein